MKILIPVAAYHAYNTAVYVEKAFRVLGHEADVVTQGELYSCGPKSADLFFGVDSAGPMDFPVEIRHKTAMWFIDSRHNCNPDRRNPPDNAVAHKLFAAGGWVFQAQKPDFERFVAEGILSCTWLPLAADPDVWRPYEEEKLRYDVGFYGNVWCEQRRDILEDIRSRFELLHVTGTPEECAEAMAQCRVIFNVSGWYGTEIAYDVNMRVFEAMALRRPLVTNFLPELFELGFQTTYHMFTYVSRPEINHMLDAALSMLSNPEEVARRARDLIVDGHTYVHRMEEALEVLREGGVI